VSPVEPTADELRDQVFASLRDGDSRLARVWVACCVARGVALGEPWRAALAAWFTFE
jgi:hypothetical protein